MAVDIRPQDDAKLVRPLSAGAALHARGRAGVKAKRAPRHKLLICVDRGFGTFSDSSYSDQPNQS
jgi:hypothetical protein